MAKVNAYVGLDMIDYDIWHGDVLEASSTEIVVDNGFLTGTYSGFDFRYLGSEVVGGTLTDFVEEDPSGVTFEVFDINVPADVAFDYVDSNDFVGLSEIALDDHDDIEGSAFRDRLRGYDGDDNINGRGGDDDLYGGFGRDYLRGGTGQNLLDGGDGFDVAFYDGLFSDYKVESRDDAVLVDSSSLSDDVFNVERLSFADATIAFDEVAQYGYRLYRAAFDRDPDQAGLSFWTHELDNGMALLRVAGGFIDSDEFRDLYGSNTSDAEFVDLLYENVLHRGADDAGYDFWLGEIDRGMSWAEVLARFSDSPENRDNVAFEIADGIRLDADVFA